MSQEDSVRASLDTWTSAQEPDADHPNAQFLHFGDTSAAGVDGADARHAYLYFPLPGIVRQGRGGTVLQAKVFLTLRGGNWGTNRNVQVRRVRDSWRAGNLTYANALSAANPVRVSEVNKGGATVTGVDGDEIEIDITNMMNDVSRDGEAWGGVRIDSDATVNLRIYSSETPKAGMRPRLFLKWARKPAPPIDLSPAGSRTVLAQKPKFSWVFVDNFGDKEQAAAQIEVRRVSDDVLMWLSPKLITTEEQYDTSADATFPTLAFSVEYKWAIRAWDGDDRVSDYSDYHRFSVEAGATLTLTNPAAGSPATVDDTSPQFTWTHTPASTQAEIELIVWRWSAEHKDWDVLHRLRRKEYTREVYQLPPGLIKKRNHDYKVRLRVWDNKDREDTAYKQEMRVFQYSRAGGITAISSLIGTPSTTEPAITFDWSRATRPDFFGFTVDGNLIEDRLDPKDLETAVDSTTYRLKWWGARPGVSHTYEVSAFAAATGGKYAESTSNDTETLTFTPQAAWLVVPNKNQKVRLVGPHSISQALGESGETQFPVGRRSAVRILDAVRGYEGSISGRLVASPDGITAAQWRDRLVTVKGYVNTEPQRIIFSDFNFPVILEDVSIGPTIEVPGHGKAFDVEIAFIQSDEFSEIKR